jgi:hypothetical protein
MKTQPYCLKNLMMLCGMLAVPLVLFAQPPAASPSATGSVSGDWTVHFQAMGHSVPGRLHFEVDGERLTGTIETAHTGPGKVQDGKWTDNKLTCTLVFERHESIVFEGERKSDGTLSGQYKTEGRTETWRAERAANL